MVDKPDPFEGLSELDARILRNVMKRREAEKSLLSEELSKDHYSSTMYFISKGKPLREGKVTKREKEL